MSAGRFIASFDLEDWFHAENVQGSLPTTDWSALEPRVERNAHELLDILAETGARSTFFVLGWVARRYPSLVRRVAAEGHEVASHTNLHRLLYRLPREELIRDLSDARDSLEQITGTRVLGVRAPNFSINDDVLECLAAAGYWYDSSFFAFSAHDRYGKISSPIDPDRPYSVLGRGLIEFPMSRVRIGPFAVPWAGGAYFRMIPFGIYRWGVERRLRQQEWFMFYFHPWELDPDEVPPPGMPRALRFRAYTGRGRMRRDLRRLLRRFGSVRIDETLRSIGLTPPHASPDQVPDATA